MKKVLNARPHPCPLPQERENHSPRFEYAKSPLNSFVPCCELRKSSGRQGDFRKSESGPSLFPLPGGEGQGEGERSN
jgi:hypothetical protein